MIYNSLDILPIATFFKILEKQDISLLMLSKPLFWNTKLHVLGIKLFPQYSNDNLSDLWSVMYEEFKELDPNNESSKILGLNIKIDKLIYKYKAVKVSLKCLDKVKSKELIDVLRDFKYKIKDNYTKEDLLNINNKVESLLIRAERIKKQLPKEDKKGNSNIYDVIASYSLILGYNINVNKVSVREFFAIQNQVKNKIKLLEKNGR